MRVRADLRSAIADLVSGRAKFAAFSMSTLPHWERLAAKIFRTWELPWSVEPGDVVQELLLGAWVAASRYDERRSPDAATYVVWTAISRAKQWCQRQRGRSGKHAGDSVAPSRHTRAATFYDVLHGGPRDDRETLVEHALSKMSIEASVSQEVVVDARSRVDAIFEGCVTEVERDALEALLAEGGDVDAAADLVYERPSWPLIEAGAASTRREARRVVSEAARGARARAEVSTWIDPRTEASCEAVTEEARSW